MPDTDAQPDLDAALATAEARDHDLSQARRDLAEALRRDAETAADPHVPEVDRLVIRNTVGSRRMFLLAAERMRQHAHDAFARLTEG